MQDFENQVESVRPERCMVLSEASTSSFGGYERNIFLGMCILLGRLFYACIENLVHDVHRI